MASCSTEHQSVTDRAKRQYDAVEPENRLVACELERRWEQVITGSFNFTKSAEESNAENLLIIRDKTLARLYLVNWQNHREYSQQYTGTR